MKVLFLRGQVPQDRDPGEICFNKLEDDVDVFTHLAMAMGSVVHVLYWGGRRIKKYADNKYVVFTPSFEKYVCPFYPDIIFARGGFKEYHEILKRYPRAKRIFYGAGKRHLPLKGFTAYHLTLQDSDRQLKKAKKKFPDIKHILWTKPVPPMFYPRNVKKDFDICYVANGGQADIKRIKWVYDTIPKHLRVLHLGIKSKYKPPKNVVINRVLKEEMPEWISRCKVGIVPYKSIDSSPRALYEMLACGLPVIVCDEVNYNWPTHYGIWDTKLEWFWGEVKHQIGMLDLHEGVNKKLLSVETAAKHILEAINEN